MIFVYGLIGPTTTCVIQNRNIKVGGARCGFQWLTTGPLICLICQVMHFIMTSSNGNIVRVTGHLCVEFTGHRWIPRTKASDADLWCFLDLRLNKRLGKQWWGWWFETPSRPLWRHCNLLARSSFSDKMKRPVAQNNRCLKAAHLGSEMSEMLKSPY